MEFKHCNWNDDLFFGSFQKKVIFADGISIYVNDVFAVADQGRPVSFIDAWSAALAYGLQLYFDFSGYSHMAIGLARTVGIRIPLNFFRPTSRKTSLNFGGAGTSLYLDFCGIAFTYRWAETERAKQGDI